MKTSNPNNEPYCFGKYNEKSEFCRKVCRYAQDCIKKTKGDAIEDERATLLEELREDFRRRDMLSLNEHLEKSGKVLTLEDKEKIRVTLENLKENGTIVEQALVILGGLVVDNDPSRGVQ